MLCLRDYDKGIMLICQARCLKYRVRVRETLWYKLRVQLAGYLWVLEWWNGFESWLNLHHTKDIQKCTYCFLVWHLTTIVRAGRYSCKILKSSAVRIDVSNYLLGLSTRCIGPRPTLQLYPTSWYALPVWSHFSLVLLKYFVMLLILQLLTLHT
jgi:hypothetical protein